MIGIIQGRLTKAPKNRLQNFPKDWKKEFLLANQCGYKYIEFFSERKFSNKNPIWSNKNIQIYKNLAKINGLKIYSFVDPLISFFSLFFLGGPVLFFYTFFKKKIKIKRQNFTNFAW
jgi:hypothetical protein